MPPLDANAQKKPRGRKPLPEHLPRETEVHPPQDSQRCACTGCDGLLRWLGEDVSEVLEIVPARFKVIRHVRPKYIRLRNEHPAFGGEFLLEATNDSSLKMVWTIGASVAALTIDFSDLSHEFVVTGDDGLRTIQFS